MKKQYGLSDNNLRCILQTIEEYVFFKQFMEEFEGTVNSAGNTAIHGELMKIMNDYQDLTIEEAASTENKNKERKEKIIKEKVEKEKMIDKLEKRFNAEIKKKDKESNLEKKNRGPPKKESEKPQG